MSYFTDPASRAEAVDISSTDHTASTVMFVKALWVGTGGNVKVDMEGGDTVTFTNVQDGSLLPLRVTKVYMTGTTATDMTLVGG